MRSSLELVGIIFLSAIFYTTVSIFLGTITTDGDPDGTFIVAWLYGVIMFTVICCAWANGTAFPL